MSTIFGVRHAPWFAFLTGTLLASLLPASVRAEGIRAENGIVIPFSLSSTPSTSEPAAAPRKLRKLPKVQYVSLPSTKRAKDPTVTGSLPSVSSIGTRTLSGFHSLVEKGAITLRESTPTNCLPGDLRLVLADVAARFGTVSIQSTHRTPGRNRRAGGARHSLHLACRAIDFRIRARASGVMAYLRSRAEVGGLKIYRNGIIHIDNGSRRTW